MSLEIIRCKKPHACPSSRIVVGRAVPGTAKFPKSNGTPLNLRDTICRSLFPDPNPGSKQTVGKQLNRLDILPHFLAAFSLIALGVISWRSRRLPAVSYLIVTLFLSALWVTSEAFARLSPDLASKLFWLKVNFSAA